MFGSKKTKAIDQAMRDAEIEQAIAAKARTDPMVYCQFVLRSAQTRRRLTLQDEHYKLVEFLQTHNRAVVIASPKLGKSTLITYGLLTWMIGCDWQRFAALLGSGLKENAVYHLRTIRDYMRTSREMQMVFPVFARPFAEDNTECLRLDREEFSFITPATIEVVSPNPKVTGRHFKLHLFDDYMTPVLAQSPYLCDQQVEMIMANESRLVTPSHPRWYIQNCFKIWDCGQQLIDKHGWAEYRMAAIDDKGRTLYSFVYSQKDIDNYPPSRVDPDLRCIPDREGDSKFKEVFIRKGRILGLNADPVYSLNPDDLPNGTFIIHGVDPAGGRAPGTAVRDHKGDDASICTVCWGPPSFWLDPECPPSLRLPLPIPESRDWLRALPKDWMVGRILWITAGKMGLPETVEAILDLHQRYGPSAFIVETNGVQIWLVQALNLVNPDIVVRPSRTGSNKHHAAFGIESLANDLAGGGIIIPSYKGTLEEFESEHEMQTLVKEMRVYQQGEHPGDRLASLWLARQGSRIFAPFVHSVGEINMGASYGLQPEPQPYAAIPGLGQMLLEKTETLGIPLLPVKKTVKESVDAETKKRFGL